LQPGEELESGAIMVNKESPLSSTDINDAALSTQSTKYKHVPLSYKGPVPSMVDKVVISSNESEHFLVKVP
jgi:DNA-directed RNA polymerase III subunit RPC2